MKLLFVHQNLGGMGGAEGDIELTARELRARGHQLALLYQHRTGRNEQAWFALFDPAYSLPLQGGAGAVGAVVKQFAPDVIYLHNLGDLDAIAALLDSGIPVARLVHDHALYCLRGCKYNYFTRRPCLRAASPFCVFPCLGSVMRRREAGWPLRWVSYLQKRREIRLNQRCSLVLVYSDYMKRELVRNGFEPPKIEVCVPFQRSPTDQAVSPLSDRNLILFVGQLIRGKGVDVLLAALARLRVPFEAAVLGEGNHRARCERLCRRLGLWERVRFHGFVSPAALSGFYREASVLALSSLWPEPFGLVGLEAMRHGVPVVAFDAGGIREWLSDGENGFLVPWKDTRGFAARLEQLLRDKELARHLGRSGLESVRRYDAAGPIERLEGLLERVARPPGHGSAQAPVRQSTLMAYD